MSKFITIERQYIDESYSSKDLMINADQIFCIEIESTRKEVKRKKKQKDGKTKTVTETDVTYFLVITLKNNDKIIEEYGDHSRSYWSASQRFKEIQLLLR